ncbi:MAG: hypothetical protein RSG52_08655 [Terrisporobacter sp.]|uniref:hypothetical protein n=1 Tax=Terrisporobacter sp. TaxID=1965305 RepID=UPI002FC6EBA4
MKKKKKQSCSCTPQCDACKTECKPSKTEVSCKKECKPCEIVCKPCETTVECTPISGCKPCPSQKLDYYCECPPDCEVTFCDECVDLAKKAEELFTKACKYEAQATDTYTQAMDCEKSAKLMSQKACNLLENSAKCENQSKYDECKAKQLMQQAEELAQRAKSLKKEACTIEKEAQSNCEKAKCLYEKAETTNEKAKCLYEQALKYDEKALQCYKTAGDKIKEYESKSKKCEEMMNKCDNKLNDCHKNCVSAGISKKYVPVEKSYGGCGCATQKPSKSEKIVEKTCSCEEEIIYVDMDNNCGCKPSSYVTPMYNLSPMQNMGNMQNKYPSLEDGCGCMMDEYSDMNEMWMNYYMYMQQMMQQTPYNK